MKMAKYLLIVFGKDRPGIIAEVTGVLFQFRANLEDITMTLLEGEFSMMVIVSLNPGLQAKVGRRFQVLGRKGALSFFWKELGPPKAPTRGDSVHSSTISYLVTAIGNDRTGIVYAVSRLLARRKLNITDLNSRVLRGGSKTLYAMALEVEIPKKFPLQTIQKEFRSLQKRLKIELSLRKVERIEF